jgi:hypothetical protein
MTSIASKLPIELWQDIFYISSEEIFQDQQFIKRYPKDKQTIVRLGTLFKGNVQPFALVCSEWWSAIRSSARFKVTVIVYHNPPILLSVPDTANHEIYDGINEDIRILLEANPGTDVDIGLSFDEKVYPFIVPAFNGLGPLLKSRLRSVSIKGDELLLKGQKLFEDYPSPLLVRTNNPVFTTDPEVLIELTNRLTSSYTRSLRLYEVQLVSSHELQFPHSLEHITHFSLARQDWMNYYIHHFSTIISVLREMPNLQAFSTRGLDFHQPPTRDALATVPVLPRLRLLNISGAPSTWVFNSSFACGQTLEWLRIYHSVRVSSKDFGTIPTNQQPIVKSLSLQGFTIYSFSLLKNFLNLSQLSQLTIGFRGGLVQDESSNLDLPSLRDLTIEGATVTGLSQLLRILKMPAVVTITTRETHLDTSDKPIERKARLVYLRKFTFDDYQMAALAPFRSITAPNLRILDLTGHRNRGETASASRKAHWLSCQEFLRNFSTTAVCDPVKGTAVEHLLLWSPGIRRLRLLLYEPSEDGFYIPNRQGIHRTESSVLKLLDVPKLMRKPTIFLPNLEILEIDGKSSSVDLKKMISRLVKNRADAKVRTLRKIVAPGIVLEKQFVAKMKALGVEYLTCALRDDLEVV